MHPLLNSPRRTSMSRMTSPPPAPSSGSRRPSLVADHAVRFQPQSQERHSNPNENTRSNSPRHASSPGYYLPPPGYVDAARPQKEVPTGSTRPTNYGGQGSWHQTSSGWAWFPITNELGKNPAAQWVEENVMPVLSHHDWSIPQAKQILSHWATLATLLAGTQATLMGYYEKDNAQGDAFNFVIASSCAGLFLEVYGALLAAATIIASISLQAPPASATNTQAEKKPLSPRAAAILDRMTVACGYIIPLGAVCELIGLGAYAAKYQDPSVTISMIVTLIFCIVSTFVAALFGWRAGSEREKVLEEVRGRARYWNKGQRQYTTPLSRTGDSRGMNQVDDDDEAIGLINSVR